MNKFLIKLLAIGSIASASICISSVNPVISVIYLISVFVNAAGYLILTGIGFIGISYIIVYVGAITVLFLFVIMMINIRLIDIVETGTQYTKNIPLIFTLGLIFTYEILNTIPFTINNITFYPTLQSFSNISNYLSSIYYYIIDFFLSITGGITNYSLTINTNVLSGQGKLVNILIPSQNSISIGESANNLSTLADTSFLNFLQIQAIGQGLYTYGAMLLIICSMVLLLSMVCPIFLTKKN